MNELTFLVFLLFDWRQIAWHHIVCLNGVLCFPHTAGPAFFCCVGGKQKLKW